MTKAERIVNATWVACERYYKDNGYQTGNDGKAIGFSYTNTEEPVCIRTLNAMVEVLKRQHKTNSYCVKAKIITVEEYKKRVEIMNMVLATIRNERATIEAINNIK